MYQREEIKDKPFTGFVAYYNDGKVIHERENFFSDKLKKQCATSWAELCLEKLVALELVWKDASKIKLTKDEYPFLKASDWYFSQTGYMDMSSRKIIVISRNIGYVKDGIINIYSVAENTGIVKSAQRAA